VRVGASAMTEKQRNAAIDLLRALSILYIVGYWHLLGYVEGLHGYKNAFTGRLTLVVLGLFTLMAGVLAGRRSIRSVRDVGGYYRGRALRILPPYALALLLFALLDLISWRQAGLGALLLPELDGRPLRTLWYVNMLVLFYILAPFLLLLRQRLALALGGPRRAVLLVAAALALSVGLLAGWAGGRVDPRLVLYLPAFATGLLLSPALLPGDGGRPGGLWVRLAPLALLAAGAIALTLPVPRHQLDSSLSALPLATIVPLLILVAATRWLEGRSLPRWLQVTSGASYFIYLFHRPLYQGLLAIVTSRSMAQPAWLWLFLLAIGVPLIVSLSWWGQWLYDRCLRALGI
jgi:peptidoglycan/LPS O-acetylase OafA/YrhL